MGWWRIDPQTGESTGQSSSLSKPPEFVLLNAVPGADNEQGACYVGDGTGDMASTLPKELSDITDTTVWTIDDIRNLFLLNKAPANVDADTMDQLREVVSAFWK